MSLECSGSDGTNQAYGTIQRVSTISKNAESSFQEKRLDLINYEENHLWCRGLTELPRNFDDTHVRSRRQSFGEGIQKRHAQVVA